MWVSRWVVSGLTGQARYGVIVARDHEVNVLSIGDVSVCLCTCMGWLCSSETYTALMEICTVQIKVKWMCSIATRNVLCGDTWAIMSRVCCQSARKKSSKVLRLFFCIYKFIVQWFHGSHFSLLYRLSSQTNFFMFAFPLWSECANVYPFVSSSFECSAWFPSCLKYQVRASCKQQREIPIQSMWMSLHCWCCYYVVALE